MVGLVYLRNLNPEVLELVGYEIFPSGKHAVVARTATGVFLYIFYPMTEVERWYRWRLPNATLGPVDGFLDHVDIFPFNNEQKVLLFGGYQQSSSKIYWKWRYMVVDLNKGRVLNKDFRQTYCGACYVYHQQIDTKNWFYIKLQRTGPHGFKFYILRRYNLNTMVYDNLGDDQTHLRVIYNCDCDKNRNLLIKGETAWTFGIRVRTREGGEIYTTYTTLYSMDVEIWKNWTRNRGDYGRLIERDEEHGIPQLHTSHWKCGRIIFRIHDMEIYVAAPILETKQGKTGIWMLNVSDPSLLRWKLLATVDTEYSNRLEFNISQNGRVTIMHPYTDGFFVESLILPSRTPPTLIDLCMNSLMNNTQWKIPYNIMVL